MNKKTRALLFVSALAAGSLPVALSVSVGSTSAISCREDVAGTECVSSHPVSDDVMSMVIGSVEDIAHETIVCEALALTTSLENNNHYVSTTSSDGACTALSDAGDPVVFAFTAQQTYDSMSHVNPKPFVEIRFRGSPTRRPRVLTRTRGLQPFRTV